MGRAVRTTLTRPCRRTLIASVLSELSISRAALGRIVVVVITPRLKGHHPTRRAQALLVTDVAQELLRLVDAVCLGGVAFSVMFCPFITLHTLRKGRNGVA